MKKLLSILLLIPSLVCAAPLLDNASTTGAGQPISYSGGKTWFQADLVGMNSPAAVIAVEGSDDLVHWSTVATITMPVSIVRSIIYAKPTIAWIRGNLVSVSGAGTKVNLTDGK